MNDNAAGPCLLANAARDWRKVNPTVFGSLVEGVLGQLRGCATDS